jgi:hypothetical protein
MTQHHTEFFPVERKKLVGMCISTCLVIILFSGVCSFNNSLINKERIILASEHLVQSQGGSCGFYGWEKGHFDIFFVRYFSVCAVTHYFMNVSYLRVTISSVTGVGGTFGPIVPEDPSYSTTLAFVRWKEIKNYIDLLHVSSDKNLNSKKNMFMVLN